MVTKKPHSEQRWRHGRVAVRMHEDLRSVLDFIADQDHRPISNMIERLLIQYARCRVTNGISNDGVLEDRRTSLAMRPGGDALWEARITRPAR